MGLRKNTEFLRATVTQEIRCVLEPERDAPQGAVRRVQILVPLSPEVQISLAPDADQKFGANRTYKMTDAPPGAAIVLWLLPNQPIFASAKTGTAFVSLTVEYHTQIV